MIRWGDERVKQAGLGITVLVVIGVVVCGLLVAWRSLPGLFGEWVGMMVGVATTPVFLEISFVILGFTIVLVVNYVKRKREGDELVYMEQVEQIEGVVLPEHAKWAVYRKEPLDGVEPSLLEQAEGAMELNDLEEVVSLLSSMSDEELASDQALRLRVKLAEVSGKSELAERLAAELEGRCGG